MVYMAGGVMPAARWRDHERTLRANVRSSGAAWALIAECADLARLAEHLGVPVGRVVRVRADHPAGGTTR